MFVDEAELLTEIFDPLDRARPLHQIGRRGQRGNAATDDQRGLSTFEVGVTLPRPFDDELGRDRAGIQRDDGDALRLELVANATCRPGARPLACTRRDDVGVEAGQPSQQGAREVSVLVGPGQREAFEPARLSWQGDENSGSETWMVGVGGYQLRM